MNRPIVRLYGLIVVLFALLIAFTSRWTVFEASSLRQNALNRRALLQQERIERGRILGAGGTVLARSVRGREGTYQRTYPTGSLFAQAIGYSYTDLGQAGLERYRNAALNGEESASNLQAILDQLQGKRPQGDEVLSTLDPAAQRAAVAALGEHRGAVVALDPRTGAVEAMASTPSYDPNLLRSSSAYKRLEHEPRLATREPRSSIRLCTWLDVQDRHGHRRDRHRAVHAAVARLRARRDRRLGRAAVQRRRRELR